MDYLAMAIAWLSPAMGLLCCAVVLAAIDVVNPAGRRTALLFAAAALLSVPFELTLFEGESAGRVPLVGLWLVGLGVPFAVAWGVFRLAAPGWPRLAAAILTGWVTIVLLTPWIYRVGICRMVGHCL